MSKVWHTEKLPQNLGYNGQSAHTVGGFSVEAVAQNNEKHRFDPPNHFEISRLSIKRPCHFDYLRPAL
jgi:hypothetical protein